MDLEIPKPPMAGTNFSVTLKGYAGKANIAIYVEDEMALEQDCDDPPCHEVLFLTRDLAGRTLRVLATGGGASKEVCFTIASKEAEGGAMMAG